MHETDKTFLISLGIIVTAVLAFFITLTVCITSVNYQNVKRDTKVKMACEQNDQRQWIDGNCLVIH